MDDPQEYKSLDELFRKTFEELPDTPSATGWDVPATAVWEKVQTQIKPPRSGWSGKSILVIASFAVALSLGLYWALSRPETPETPAAIARDQPAVAVVETPATNPETPAEIQIPEQTTTPERVVHSRRQSTNALRNGAPAANTTQAMEEGALQRPSGSAPLPGTKPASPNTTIRRQAEAWRSAPWAQPLALLPTYLQSQVIRPVPESLKALSNPDSQK